MSMVMVRIPAGYGPGQEFIVQMPDGQQMAATVPDGCAPGQMMKVRVPAAMATEARPRVTVGKYVRVMCSGEHCGQVGWVGGFDRDGGVRVLLPKTIMPVTFAKASLLPTDLNRDMIHENKTETITNVEALRDECASLQALNHPNIVRLLAVYEEPRSQKLHLVTELLTGGELSERLADGRLEEAEAADIMRQLLRALCYCHESNNVCHRDVKLENVVYSDTRPEGAPFRTHSRAAPHARSRASVDHRRRLPSAERAVFEPVRIRSASQADRLWHVNGERSADGRARGQPQLHGP